MCTGRVHVVILTPPGDEEPRPEHTMVDGLVLMRSRSVAMRRVRQLAVTKLRGTAFLEGDHVYDISPAGVQVYPRLEALLRGAPHSSAESHLVTSGITGLDPLLGGGLERDNRHRAARQLRGLARHRRPAVSGGRRTQGDRAALRLLRGRGVAAAQDSQLGLAWRSTGARALIELAWQPAAEHHLDILADRLLERIAA